MKTRESGDGVTGARRIVVKIGSRAFARDSEATTRLAQEMVTLAAARRSFVVVSSGAIALGCQRLGYRTRPTEMARLQAAAAAGQTMLMHRWEEGFARSSLVPAQVLITHADLADRERLNNAREALGALIDAGAVPIINENDTVATEEIRFGDNDQLAAMVAPLVGAELLVLLTDVDGVLDPDGRRIAVLTHAARLGEVRNGEAKLGSGGISSKLDAAWKASRSGAAVIIARASEPRVLTRILAGEDLGTRVPASRTALRARKHWIAFTLRPRGVVMLDVGAVAAMRRGNSSLLPVGVIGVRGDFAAGDSVRLVGADGSEVGCGLTRLGALDVARAAGKHSRELAALFGAGASDLVVVHKDDLVLD
jgi:glutamate 5-kinase